MNFRSDDDVRGFLADAVQEFTTVRSLAQVFLSVIELRSDRELEALLDGAERRPEVRKALEQARCAYETQGEQSTIVLTRTSSVPPKSALAARMRRRGNDGKG